MPEQHTWIGASGTRYQYRVYPADHDFPAVPANYFFVALANKKWHPVYVGQTSDLSERFESHHRRLCIDRRATHIHIHRNDVEQARLYEEADIIRKHQPPCNG